MHIGFIEDTLLHGGTQIWVTEAVRAFLARAQAVTLIAPEGSWVVEQSRPTQAHIVTYDWEAVVAEDKRNITIWTNALRECDVVICTVHPPRQGFHCAVFAARCIREGALDTHLITKTGTIVPEYRREFYLPDERIRSSVITITDFTRRYLIETYKIPPERVSLIYQGTDVKRFQHSEAAREIARRRYPIHSNAAPVLGCLGSFEPRKGQTILFAALRELAHTTFPDIHLILVGDGPDEEMLKHKARELGLQEHISFFPFTNEPNYVFERIDITVLSSIYKEGLPNVLLESMSMGVPVVASNIGGVPEIVIDGVTGFMVTPGDAAALARAIAKLWTDQERYLQMRKNARNLMVKHFDKETQFDRFLSHFQTLISPAQDQTAGTNNSVHPR